MSGLDSLMSTLAFAKFKEIFTASSRQTREICFKRHDIRKPKQSLRQFDAAKEERIRLLYQRLQEVVDKELLEALLRSWLLTKRPMLACALDYLQIPHEQGLTDSDDFTKIEKLTAAEVSELYGRLREVAEAEDIYIYLKFLAVPFVDELQIC